MNIYILHLFFFHLFWFLISHISLGNIYYRCPELTKKKSTAKFLLFQQQKHLFKPHLITQRNFRQNLAIKTK